MGSVVRGRGVPPERVMLIRADLPGEEGVSVGSGTLIKPRLILTAAHVVFDDGGNPLDSTRAGPPEAVQLYAARVVWPASFRTGSGPGELDVALLEITDPDWQPPRISSARLGHLTCRGTGVSCEATGFPRVLRDPNGTRDSDQVSGTVNPGSRRIVGRYDIHVTSTTPDLPTNPRAPSAWSGMSGAGLFSSGLLVGVVIIDEPEYQSKRLSAVPVPDLRKMGI